MRKQQYQPEPSQCLHELIYFGGIAAFNSSQSSIVVRVIAIDAIIYAAAATAAKSLQSCPTLCDPMDGSPPGSPVPGILQARTLEWVAISFSNALK